MPVHTHWLYRPTRAVARLLAMVLLLAGGLAQAVTIEFQPVADGVYAHVGDRGALTVENEGLNAYLELERK